MITIMCEDIESCLVAAAAAAAAAAAVVAVAADAAAGTGAGAGAAADDHKPQPCMMMSKQGNTFTITGPLCGKLRVPPPPPPPLPPLPPYKGSVIWRLDIFNVSPNKQLNKQSMNLWYETPTMLMRRHCDA